MAAFLFLSAGQYIASEGSYNVLLQEWFPVPPTEALVFLVFRATLSKRFVKQEITFFAVANGIGGVGE